MLKHLFNLREAGKTASGLGQETGGGSSLRTRLMLWLVPPVVIILLVTGYLLYMTASNFIDIALQRTSKLQTMAVRHEIEGFLDRCRQDLLVIAQDSLEVERMRKFMADRLAISGLEYRELAYISQIDRDHKYLVAQNGQIIQLLRDQIDEIRPNPLLVYDKVKALEVGEVFVSPITEVEHPFPSPENPNQKISSRVITFATPIGSAGSQPYGYLFLSIDARMVRNILSVYNSSRSPLWAFPRTAEVRYSFLFDSAGWMLFQSDDPEKAGLEISTDLARSPYTGTLGRPGLPGAFRPASVYGPYWKMVGDVREGKFGLVTVRDLAHQSEKIDNYYLAYAPVMVRPANGRDPTVYAGIGYVDRSRLTAAAGYKQVDIMFIITLAAVLIVTLMITFVGRAITRPILKLARSVNELQRTGDLQAIALSTRNFEAGVLLNAVNNMIATMKQQLAEIEIRDRKIETVSLTRKAELRFAASPESSGSVGPQIPGLFGFGPSIDRLRSDIAKAAQVDVDVLIVGETGTGKQLAAEAIHLLSRRSEKPFISINCGELDENLLLDTLFGHIKGAFTEAKTDRKGAFLEAEGGTLFLDEIQTASAGVQQALLRAIAVRKIKALGSDRETAVDVRLIAATNVDLAELIEQRRFRSDLYFRLKVISLYTPPLRSHRENIPVLAVHFLKEMEPVTGKQGMGLSRGALEKLKSYDWPGNVRELKNCLTRAAVMSEGSILQAHEIQLEGDRGTHPEHDPNSELPQTVSADLPSAETVRCQADRMVLPSTVKLNRRQKKALPSILQTGETTRSDYQSLVGGNLPSRTALYDLKDLVEKGVLVRVGQGPATRYLPVDREAEPAKEQ